MRRITSSKRRDRAGATILEIILVMPILVIILVATGQLGYLLYNRQHLEMASRTGALEGSELSATLMATADGDPVPTQIVNAVNAQLNTAGLPNADDITVVHNVGGVKTLRSVADLDCPDPTGLPSAPTAGQYIRVTVCLETTDMTPNLLNHLCFDLAGKVNQQTTTFRVE